MAKRPLFFTLLPYFYYLKNLCKSFLLYGNARDFGQKKTARFLAWQFLAKLIQRLWLLASCLS